VCRAGGTRDSLQLGGAHADASMKAVVYHAHGGTTNLHVEDVPVPPVGRSDVLIRVRAVALNGFDPMMLHATTKLKVPLPMIPCADFAGEIVQVGADLEATAC